MKNVDKEFYKNNLNKYELLAVNRVIAYFKVERIRVNIDDFGFYNSSRDKEKFAFVHSYMETADNTGHTVVEIKYKSSRFKKYVANKFNNFLKYVNARVTKDTIMFTFDWNELDADGCGNSEEFRDREKIDKVKDLIDKLFALAKDNPSENEALMANNRAQALLAKYHLTLAEVYGAEAKIDGDIEQVVSDVGVGNAKCNWRYGLANAVSGGYCCKYYSIGNMTDGRVVFYGYKEDVLLARRMYTFLFDACHRLGLDYQRENPNAFNAYVSFCRGFVKGATSEMQKQCTALALVIQPEVEDKWKEFSSNFRVRNERENHVDGNAFNDGFVEGKRSMKRNYIEENTKKIQ